MQRLPLGVQSFSFLREFDCVYVDKTMYIHDLMERGFYYFLSRPRRFGKSLLLSTIKEIFEGNREIFKGLYIEDKIDWKPHPVLFLDWSNLSVKGREELKTSLMNYLKSKALEFGIGIEGELVGMCFRELITKLREKFNQRVVILIDEYDKPIVDNLDNTEIANQNRDVLRELYSVMKGEQSSIRFIMLTGVSKIGKMQVFSGVNNLTDISLEERYNAICGYTENEFYQNFQEQIENEAHKLSLSVSDLKRHLKNYYNGYSWNGAETVYNPTTLLAFLESGNLTEHWYMTGSSYFLTHLIAKKEFDVSEIENKEFLGADLDSISIENLSIEPLLFQTGYLTIASQRFDRLEGQKLYRLKFPNHEVKSAFFNQLIPEYGAQEASEANFIQQKIKKAVRSGDVESFIEEYNRLFAKIPYDLHLPYEAYYHSLVYLTLSVIGLDVQAEVHTFRGRMDAKIVLQDLVWIVEFKYAGEGDPVALAELGYAQILDKEYVAGLAAEKKIIRAGVGIVRGVCKIKYDILNDN